MGRSAVPLAGLDGPELLRAWEAAATATPARRAGAVLDAVLTDLPVRADLLPVGSCDTLLLALRVGTFGALLSGVTTCPHCGAEADLDVDVAEILGSLPAVESVESEPDPLQAGDYLIRYRLPTPSDLDACSDKQDAAALLLARCVVAADRASTLVAPEELPADVRAVLAAAIADGDPAADLRLRATCPDCGTEHTTRLDIAEFFLAELAAAARGLLTEIDALASRYGWSEAEIMALGRTRRQTYLELR